MTKYFAKLDGDLSGIDAYIRFESVNLEQANEFATEQAYEHYSSYDDPTDEEDDPKYFATVELYNAAKHDEYFETNNKDDWEQLI